MFCFSTASEENLNEPRVSFLPQSKQIMLAKEESLLETINKLKSDIDKGKEKSGQQKTQIRDLQQVCSMLFYMNEFDHGILALLKQQ